MDMIFICLNIKFSIMLKL